MRYRKKIYFDGFLPLSKSKTRSSRLMNYTKQMSTYYEAWPQVIPGWSGKPTSTAAKSSLFRLGPSAVISSKIPAVPFLVPAVIEKLQSSPRYQRITAVLPGEADLYCARYVKEHGGTVFTGDSDLLVHDLGDMGSVSFFRDLEAFEYCNIKSLKCCQYTAGIINDRLGLKQSHGLQALAFEMVMDPHGSFPQLLQKAKDLKAVLGYPGMYEEFAKEYQSLPKEVLPCEGPEISAQKSLQTILRTLDPRISEYVLQFPKAAAAADITFPTSQPIAKCVDMYLPFLLDCPSKTSAWEMSTAVRQLAYGLMNLAEPKKNHITSVVEHRRQQKGSRGREWQLPTNDEIEEASIALVALVEKVSQSSSSLPDFDIWRALAFHQDLDYAYSTGKQSLGSLIFKPTGTQRRLSWDTVHFSAQLQGSFYSFRMLKQILDVVSAFQVAGKLSAALQHLTQLLQSFPDLTKLPNFYTDLKSFQTPEDSKSFLAVQNLYQDDTKEAVDDKIELKPSKKDKKKKRKRDEGSTPSIDISRKPNNMFELLNSV